VLQLLLNVAGRSAVGKQRQYRPATIVAKSARWADQAAARALAPTMAIDWLTA
jgi:hypothetical protein